MLDRLAGLAYRRPRWIALAAVVFFVASGAIGGSAFDVLKPFGFEDPDSESTVLTDRAERIAGQAPNPGVIALLEPGEPIRSKAGREELADLQRALDQDPAIASTASWLDRGERRFLSTDGEATYVLAYLANGAGGSEVEEKLVDRLVEEFEDDPDVTLGGIAVASSQIGTQTEEDLQRAELLALPFVLLLSFLVFRSLVAAMLPPLVGILAIAGTLLGLRLFAEVTDISIFAINLVTGLGLGLAIDYSLFVVSRYREELANHGPGLEALRRTMATAGRTVVFSSLTVAAALAALMVFPQRFLFSMGLGGAMVALIAAVVSLTVLPAVLAMLGERVNSLAPARFRRAAEADARGEQGRWYRFSRWVMKRPGTIALSTAAVLIVVGLPFTQARFVFADAGILPTELSARQVDQALQARFDAHQLTPVTIHFETGKQAGDGGGSESAGPAPVPAPIERFAADVAEVDGIRAVVPPQEIAPGLVSITAIQKVDDYSAVGERTIEDIRALPSEIPFRVGGNSAALVDQKQSLSDHLKIAVPIIAIATLVLLFLMTGSVVLPVKALIMNLLTVSAAFGILVLIFQDGRFEGLINYDSQGALDSSQPILLFALIFGLSTDYGVFLLTRIKEAHDDGAPTSEAVAIGLEKTGRIVTFAALLFCVAIGAFVTSDIIFLKEAGLGTAIGVLIDATIVRALLVPSLMQLLGEWNWWAPRPLRRLHERIGLSET
jgi:uncharacterized membrane protein YdfJ with MMPL/SSD domain